MGVVRASGDGTRKPTPDVAVENGRWRTSTPRPTYLFHLVPVVAAVRWTLDVTPKGATASDFACTVEVHLRPVLGVLPRLSFLGHFLANHVDEEAHGFGADITRKIGRASDAVQLHRQEANPTGLRPRQ